MQVNIYTSPMDGMGHPEIYITPPKKMPMRNIPWWGRDTLVWNSSKSIYPTHWWKSENHRLKGRNSDVGEVDPSRLDFYVREGVCWRGRNGSCGPLPKRCTTSSSDLEVLKKGDVSVGAKLEAKKKTWNEINIVWQKQYFHVLFIDVGFFT